MTCPVTGGQIGSTKAVLGATFSIPLFPSHSSFLTVLERRIFVLVSARVASASKDGKVGSKFLELLILSEDSVWEHWHLFRHLFSPQVYFAMEHSISWCAGLILLLETSLFPALHTCLGGVKVMGLIFLSDSSFEGQILLVEQPVGS